MYIHINTHIYIHIYIYKYLVWYNSPFINEVFDKYLQHDL